MIQAPHRWNVQSQRHRRESHRKEKLQHLKAKATKKVILKKKPNYTRLSVIDTNIWSSKDKRERGLSSLDFLVDLVQVLMVKGF